MRLESAAVCLVGAVLAVAWTLYTGKDLSWDVVNHHLYLPYSLLTGRDVSDLFAAGPQSYQNPLGYIPGYFLASSRWPDWAVGAGLATLHAVPMTWGVHHLAVTLWGPAPEQRRWRLLGLALALCAPIFLIVAGTTSSDPLSAGLLAVAIAAALDRRPSTRLLLMGGLALGLAVAIKLTNGVFAVALAPVLLLRIGLRQLRWTEVAAFSLASVCAAVAGMAHWSLWLWRSFASPVFPLFNNLFQSPFAPVGRTTAGRFLPDTAWDLLARLWEMADFSTYVVTEAFAPDVRPICALVLVAAVLLVSVARRPASALSASPWARADMQLLVLLAVAYVVWMVTSANARYVVVWFVLVGLGLVRAAEQLLPQRAAAVCMAVLLAAQTTMYVSAGNTRLNAFPWTGGPYLAVKVAPRLANEPFLHLSIGVLSYAAVATALHPKGALINVVGQLAMPTDGPLGAAFQERLSHWQGRTRFLLQAPPASLDLKADREKLERSRFITYRFGLDIDWDDCEPLLLRSSKADPADRAAAPTRDGDARATKLLSCGARPLQARDEALEARIATAEAVFALIETACPQVYGPRPFASDISATIVQRLYSNTDARVEVSSSNGVTLSHFRSLSPVSLGSIGQVLANRGQDACAAWKLLSRQ